MAYDGAADEDDGGDCLLDDLRAGGEPRVVEGVEDFDGKPRLVGAPRHVEDFEPEVGEELAQAARDVTLRNLLNGQVVQSSMDVAMTGFIYSLAYQF